MTPGRALFISSAICKSVCGISNVLSLIFHHRSALATVVLEGDAQPKLVVAYELSSEVFSLFM